MLYIIIVDERGGMRLGTLPCRSEKGEIVVQLPVLLICKTENVLTVTVYNACLIFINFCAA